MGYKKHYFHLSQAEHPERFFAVDRLTPEDKKVLDIGCGNHKSIDYAIGLDILPITDMQSSMDELDIDSGSIDVIISRHSLEHTLDLTKTLNEWKRVLKVGGKMIIVLPDHQYIDTMQPALSGGVHMHAFTRDSFKNLIGVFGGLWIQEQCTVIPEWSFGNIIIKK